MVGETEWSLLTSDSGHAAFESKARATGLAALLDNRLIVERSELNTSGDRLAPIRYRYRRSGKKAKQVEIDFDWSRGQADVRVNERASTLQIPPGTLDKLSYLLAVMADLAAGKRSMTYTVADAKNVETYTIEKLGQESVSTPLGDFHALKVRRASDQGVRETTVWCAPTLGYLPVKISHRDRDGRISLRIDRLEGIRPTQ